MRPISLLELVASSRGGGAVHVRDLVTSLPQERFAPQVGMPMDGGNVLAADLVGIPFHQIDMARGVPLTALRKVRQLAVSIDILHVHGARAALFGRLAAASLGPRRPRVVYSIHGFAAPHYGLLRRQAILLLERAFAGVTDQWICVSHAERAAVLATGLYDPQRVRVIQNGINWRRFDCSKRTGNVRLAIGIPPDAFVVTTVCRLFRPRDFPTLLRGFGITLEVVPGAHLVIVGDGPERAAVEQSAVSLDMARQVHLLGMRRDVPEILADSDAFVLASQGWEGLPLTVLEAMAAGLPVVASDVGGTREAVQEGETGYLFRAGDAAALGQHLWKLADQPQLAATMGGLGRRRVEEYFGVERMAAETAALYTLILARES